MKPSLCPFNILSFPSNYFLKESPLMDNLLNADITLKEFLFFKLLLQKYAQYVFLPSKRETEFNSFISLPIDSTLKGFSCKSRSRYLYKLDKEGLIVRAHSRGNISFYITEHYLALYFFFLQLSPKVAEKNFDVLKEKVGEIMRKRPNYEDTEAILKACVNLDSNMEVADNSSSKETAVDKKGKKILRKPKSKELKEDQWLRAVKRAFKEKALSYDKKCAEEALSKTNANLIQKSRPEDVNTFKEKADFAADAFMQYFIKEGDAVASINRFAARFSSWMHNGFKPKAEGGGKNALTTDAERQRNKERYENLMKNLGGNNSEY